MERKLNLHTCSNPSHLNCRFWSYENEESNCPLCSNKEKKEVIEIKFTDVKKINKELNEHKEELDLLNNKIQYNLDSLDVLETYFDDRLDEHESKLKELNDINEIRCNIKLLWEEIKVLNNIRYKF